MVVAAGRPTAELSLVGPVLEPPALLLSIVPMGALPLPAVPLARPIAASSGVPAAPAAADGAALLVAGVVAGVLGARAAACGARCVVAA